MITNPNPSSRLRPVGCLLFFVAAGIAALGAIGSSRAIGQRVEDNAFHLGWIGFSEDDARPNPRRRKLKQNGQLPWISAIGPSTRLVA
jgi:hypothetical protein